MLSMFGFYTLFFLQFSFERERLNCVCVCVFFKADRIRNVIRQCYFRRILWTFSISFCSCILKRFLIARSICSPRSHRCQGVWSVRFFGKSRRVYWNCKEEEEVSEWLVGRLNILPYEQREWRKELHQLSWVRNSWWSHLSCQYRDVAN